MCLQLYVHIEIKSNQLCNKITRQSIILPKINDNFNHIWGTSEAVGDDVRCEVSWWEIGGKKQG